MQLFEEAPPRASLLSGETHSALLAPRSSLASCVRGFVSRSTLGATLHPEQRFNHFPATLLCTLSWLVQGESKLVRFGDESIDLAVPRVCLIGPYTVPTVSFNPGPAEGFMVGLTPAAMAALAGLDISTLVNRIVPLAQAFDAPWQAMADAVLQAPDTAARIQIVEQFLEPRWKALRHATVSQAQRYRFWAENLALRASQSGVGSSLRQAERRIKQWAGLPMRDLRRMVRAEDSFFQVRDAHESGVLDWASMAAEGGFSDQAHLCREVRRITGHSPAALVKSIEQDECFWAYRLRD